MTTQGASARAEPQPPSPGKGLYNATASGKEIMQLLAANREEHRPLLGAHLVALVAMMEHGIAARALREMGVDGASLASAAQRLARTTGSV